MSQFPALATFQKKEPSGAPFNPTAAMNGLSVNGPGNIVLGNDVGGTLARLLSNREIPTNGFNIAITGTGQVLIGTTISTGELLQVVGDARIQRFILGTFGGSARLFSGSEIVIQSNSATGTQVQVLNAVAGFTGAAISEVATSQVVPRTSFMFRVATFLSQAFAVRGDATVQVTGAIDYSIRATAVAATFGLTDHTINANGTFAVNLPTAVGIQGRVYVTKNSGAGVITLTPFAGQTIDGAATKVLAAGAFVTVQSDNANWIIIG
jgi:hypothetical protein